MYKINELANVRRMIIIFGIVFLMCISISFAARSQDDWIVGLDFETDETTTYAGVVTFTDEGASIDTGNSFSGSNSLQVNTNQYVKGFVPNTLTNSTPTDIALVMAIDPDVFADKRPFGGTDTIDYHLWNIQEDGGNVRFGLEYPSVSYSQADGPIWTGQWRVIVWEQMPSLSLHWAFIADDLKFNESGPSDNVLGYQKLGWGCYLGSSNNPLNCLQGHMDDICIINLSAGPLTQTERTLINTSGCKAFYDSLAPVVDEYPVISNIICNSSIPDGYLEPYLTEDNTPLFTLTTDITADCYLSDANNTYVLMNNTGALVHSGIFPNNKSLSIGSDTVWIQCNHTTFFTSQSIAMNILKNTSMVFRNPSGYEYMRINPYGRLQLGNGSVMGNSTLWIDVGKTTLADSWDVRSDEKLKAYIRPYDNNIVQEDIPTYKYIMRGEDRGEPIYELVNRSYTYLECSSISLNSHNDITYPNGTVCNYKTSSVIDNIITGYTNDKVGFMVEDVPVYCKNKQGSGIEVMCMVAFVYEEFKKFKLEVLLNLKRINIKLDDFETRIEALESKK